MSARNLLQPLAAQLCARFENLGRPCKPIVLHQLFHAAIGTVSPEVASSKKLPIQVCRAIDTRQYNLFATIERAKVCLALSDLQAVGVAEEIIESLRAAGIGVNQVQLLLDPAFSKVKKEAFRALCKSLDLNEEGAKLPPKTATLALAARLTPQLDTSWIDRFSVAAAFPKRGASELVDLVTNSECYLWVLPPADHQATAAATHDRFWGEQGNPSAEMGMGFSIIQAGWTRPKYPLQRGADAETYTQYSLYSPMWSWRAPGTTWRLGNILRSTIHDGAYWTQERLRDVLPGGFESLPRIHGCNSCRMLFIDKTAGHPDVPTQCLCGEACASGEQQPSAPNS